MPPLPDKLINQLPSAVLPLTGTELVPLQQGGTTVQTPVSNIGTGTTPGLASQYRMADGSAKYAAGPVVNIKDFGAVGNGIADDTAAINAAYASVKGHSAIVIWPEGNYLTTGPINIGDANGGAGAQQSGISTIGMGPPFGVQISYNGPTNGNAVVIARNPFSRFEGIVINNITGTRGTTTGLAIGGAGPGADPNGTQSYSSTYHNCIIGNFSVGIQDGNFGTFSECTFIDIAINQCDTGYTQNSFNCLNTVLIDCSISGCGVGVTNGASENVTVFGGSSSGNATDFLVQANSQAFLVESFRSENATGQNFQSDSGGGVLVIRNSMFKDQAPSQGTGIAIRGTYKSISVQDSFFHGWIFLEQPGGLIEIRNNWILPDPNTSYPFILSGKAVGNADGCHMILKQNRSTFNASTMVPDFEGIIKNNVIGSLPSPFQTMQAILPTWTKTKWQIPPTNVGAPYGFDTNIFSHVRQLAEGPQPGVFATPPVINLTANAATASGNVLNFASTTGVIVGMQVADTTNAVIPGSPQIAYVTQVTSTTVTISNNVTGGGVLNGDNIRFMAGVVAPTPGNNLRVQGKFASSGTLAFTFVRNQSVTGNTSSTITAAAGQFFPADVGKPIELPGFATLPGWSNWFGAIATYVDSTHVTVLAGGSNNPGSGTVTAVIGQNEPDGNYMVLVTPNANETMWVDTITATGFTVHSSNTTSTATVTCLIVR